MGTLNVFLVVLLALCIIALVMLRRHKSIVSGIVTDKNIDLSNRMVSYVTINTGVGKRNDVLLAFDTCAKIGCHHSWFFGRSQCFHDSALSLQKDISIGGHISVTTEGKTEGAQYVRRILNIKR